jgi:alkanesulfonate monooxygenase SsuD/methylene tetrahydromethanopterin reductase-like flavin-dependent oxidoreductase (luciferase family)
MKAGVVYPQIELGGDPGAVKAFAQAAEDLGYDHIVIYDHVLGAVHAGREPKLTGPYKESDPFHEPLVTYAYLAGVTKKLELATGVIILPQRQTALFAKQAADVDLFSDGRLRLGVGVGWNWVEYDGLEMSGHFRRRGKRQEQQIALIRKLWEEHVVDHEDSDHRIDRAGILPRPKGRSRSGWEVSARPRSTGRPGSGTDSCFRAGLKPRRSKSSRGSWRSCASSEGMPMHSASSPSSNTVAGTTNGPAILRRGARLEEATFLS